MSSKNLFICNLDFLIPIETWWCKPLIFQTQIIWSNRICNLKYQRSTAMGCKDIWFIYIYTLLVCLSVCIQYVKTAKPIGPKFCVGPHITPGKVYWPSKLNKKLLKKYKFFLKMSQLKEENLSTIENDLNLPTFRATTAKIIYRQKGARNFKIHDLTKTTNIPLFQPLPWSCYHSCRVLPPHSTSGSTRRPSPTAPRCRRQP